jgi:hypothetical protein
MGFKIEKRPVPGATAPSFICGGEDKLCNWLW